MSERVGGWRKLAGASWRAPDDPQFFGDLEIDATALLSYVEELRGSSEVRVTITHLVARAVACGLAEVPELRVRLARGRLHQRESVDVFVIVSAERGRELTGFKICDADRKTAAGIAAETTRQTRAIADGTDVEVRRSKAMLSRVPRPLLRPVLNLAAWLSSDLNLDLSRFGMPRQAFGGALITSVGMFGVTRAYAPLARYYRVPLLVLVGAVQPRPVAVDNEVVIRPMLTLTATIDHRYADGSHSARLADAVRRYCADPAAADAALD
jgi:pyruvate/2-oxoglutarate dehydrogenase complex dihydrolipoamide acyltransferase (E2) component